MASSHPGRVLLLWFMDLTAAGNDPGGYSCRLGSSKSGTETRPAFPFCSPLGLECRGAREHGLTRLPSKTREGLGTCGSTLLWSPAKLDKPRAGLFFQSSQRFG